MTSEERHVENDEKAEPTIEDLKPKKEGRKKPSKKISQSSTKTNYQEFEAAVIELAKKGDSPSKIGMILRDSYGIPKASMFGKKIKSLLDEKNLKYKTEEETLKERVGKLKNHLNNNKHDYSAKKSLNKSLWVLNKFEKAREIAN